MNQAIKGYRVMANLLQQEMASKLEMSISTYKRKETGQSEFTLSEAKALYKIIKAKLPEVKFEDLFLINE